jgi:hypothetical protein
MAFRLVAIPFYSGGARAAHGATRRLLCINFQASTKPSDNGPCSESPRHGFARCSNQRRECRDGRPVHRYRRDDSQGYAGRMAGDLSRILGEDRVFSDIEIPFGSDFAEMLHRAIAASDALLVVIGQRWAGDRGEGMPSRLHDPDDWVRTEIEAAFAQGKPVFPVLVGGATMPLAEQLPLTVQRMARLQAARLDDRHWQTDINLLMAQVRAALPDGFDATDRPTEAPAAATSVAEVSPAQVLREIAQRLFEESRARQTATPPRAGGVRGLGAALLQTLLRRLRGLLGLVVAAGMIYVGLRLFGDDELLRGLNAFEARLELGWQRLQQHLSAR